MKHSKAKFTLAQMEKGIRAGNPVVLAKALTLVESTLLQDQRKGRKLIHRIPGKNSTVRVGITGAPGVGKSTFIEAFGKYLTSTGKKVAVLAIDPSSQKTKGSILGDKTRMQDLSKDPQAFIRPTASGTSQGGVANSTYESILLCEAAGFDVVIVETVGVGQSEVAVRGLVDFFLLLMLPGAGDDLQGIKKGIMEMADGIVITKADDDNLKRAKQAQADLKHALHLFQKGESGCVPGVVLSSALENKGISETWQMIESYQSATKANHYFQNNRNFQKLSWFHQSLTHHVLTVIQSGKLRLKVRAAEAAILNNKMLPSQAAEEIIRAFLKT